MKREEAALFFEPATSLSMAVLVKQSARVNCDVSLDCEWICVPFILEQFNII